MHHMCCASCDEYRVLMLVSVSSVSIEFRKRVGCEDPFDYVGSSASRRHSSSKRDLRQDDHFPRYHYYHCHASLSLLSFMSRCLPLVKYQPLNNAMITFNLFDLANQWLAMLLLAYHVVSVASCRCSCFHVKTWVPGYITILNVI